MHILIALLFLATALALFGWCLRDWRYTFGRNSDCCSDCTPKNVCPFCHLHN
jgi:hypothetical protein